MHKRTTAPGFRIQALGMCTLLTLLALVEFHRLHPVAEEVVNWREQFHILLALTYLSAFKICLDSGTGNSYQVLTLQLFMILNMNYPERGNVSLTAFLFGIPLYEISILSMNTLASSLFIALVALLSAVLHPVPFWDQPIRDADAGDLVFLAGSLLFQTLLYTQIRHLSTAATVQAATLSRQSSSIENLLNANLDFQTYAAEVGEKSTIEERKRLTREVHDIVGYTLINIRMMLEASIELTPQEYSRLRELLQRARDQVMSGLLETRRALRNFRAIDSAPMTGPNRIQHFVKSFSLATGITVEVNYGNILRSFGPDIDSAVVRIIQESMTNAFRHGKATEIQIGLWVDDGRLLIKISDNGIGTVDIKPGIGLTGMAERLESLHGSLNARSAEHGFIVSATIPLNRTHYGQ